MIGLSLVQFLEYAADLPARHHHLEINLVHLITRSAARFYALQTLKTRVSDIALPTYTTLSYAPHSNVDERQSTLDLDMKLPILSNSLPFAT